MRTLKWPMETRQIADPRWGYALLIEDIQVDDFHCESYGVAAKDLLTGETSQVRHVTVCSADALDLLGALARNAVTPLTLSDVVEDWLAR